MIHDRQYTNLMGEQGALDFKYLGPKQILKSIVEFYHIWKPI